MTANAYNLSVARLRAVWFMASRYHSLEKGPPPATQGKLWPKISTLAKNIRWTAQSLEISKSRFNFAFSTETKTTKTDRDFLGKPSPMPGPNLVADNVTAYCTSI